MDEQVRQHQQPTSDLFRASSSMQSTHPEAHTVGAIPHGMEAFEHWLLACEMDPWEPLTPEAAKPYRFIWQAWLKYLAGQSDAIRVSEPFQTQMWTEANATQVVRFLNHATRSQKKLDQPTDITRRRYWRVLDRVYAHAVLHQWVAQNPALGLSAQDLPPSEDPKGAILSPEVWSALEAQIPAAADLISARDRAVLMLLMDIGLTSEEARNLTIDDVQWLSETVASIAVIGDRDNQNRVLTITPETSAALKTWIGYRSGYAAMEGQPALFCTRKAPMLSTHTVLHLVTKTIKAGCQRHGLSYPPRLGPQSIRNTVIVRWLRSGMSKEEVLQRAGLKSPHALWHLKAFI